ncbi:MAG: ATP-binding cassette domain-containing protein [Holosporales bacterium]|nr:ATP-binding cassette domain-containing protein [Holosporales bacterium]
MSAPLITVQQAYKSFGTVRVLEAVDLTIKAHSIVGLVGPSGSGKSTLLRCIQGLDTLDAGGVTCRGKVGFMFQDFQLFPHMTVLQNILYAPRLKEKGAALEQRAQKVLEQLKISAKSSVFPMHLSGGQKQRVALARCLMGQPDILLCDEPTSGLDIVTTTEVVSLLQSVCALGVTMVLASHDLEFLAQIATRVVFLKEGHVVADEEPCDTSSLKERYTTIFSHKE